MIAEAYERAGFPEEWRRHHQGGLTGYKGREVFAVPGEPTPLPPVGAVAWNPSVTGGGKSEDTVLVTVDRRAILTPTPELPELETAGPPARRLSSSSTTSRGRGSRGPGHRRRRPPSGVGR